MADAQKILGLRSDKSSSSRSDKSSSSRQPPGRQGGTKARPENITNLTKGSNLRAYLRILNKKGSYCDIVIKLYSGNSAAKTFREHCDKKLYKDTWIDCQTNDKTKWQGGGGNKGSQKFVVRTTSGGSVWDTANMPFGDVLSGLQALPTGVARVRIADCDIKPLKSS